LGVGTVADLVAFGGQEKTYEVSVDPSKLSKYDITLENPCILIPSL
jgi:cobalt-zinc-cadmium resistance protein CzcA